MDPLSALAIAAAVVQFADIGARLLVKSWEKGKLVRDATRGTEVANLAEQLSSLKASLHEALEGLPRGSAATSAQVKLRRACAICDDICQGFHQAASGGSVPDSTAIGLMRGKLVDIKAEVTETVLFCLW